MILIQDSLSLIRKLVEVQRINIDQRLMELKLLVLCFTKNLKSKERNWKIGKSYWRRKIIRKHQRFLQEIRLIGLLKELKYISLLTYSNY
jgi:hypothetical protein